MGLLAATWTVNSSLTWALQTVGTPGGGGHGEYGKVQCFSTTECIASGYWKTGANANQSLVEQFTGVGSGFGAAQASSDMIGTSTSNLFAGDVSAGGDDSGLSCPTATFCMAAGNYTPSVDQALVMQWNGWNSASYYSNLNAPIDSGAFNNDLSGVSCPTTTWCMTVGTFSSGGTTDQALAQKWNSTPSSALAL